MRTTLLVPFAAALVSAALVTGCSNDSADSSTGGRSVSSTSASSAGESESAQFNDADVAFAHMMYPHHAQAVEMAALADGRTDNRDVLSLASEIAAAQQPEMDRLTAWLAEWGRPSPSSTTDAMDVSSGNGMMTQQDMDGLMAASGSDFDRQWLTMMIAHHTGAVAMANTEITDGSNPDAQDMARSIAATQQQEIGTMQRLLG